VASRTLGLRASIAEADRRSQARTAEANTFRPAINLIFSWIRRDPIYANAVPNTRVLEVHVPEERLPKESTALGNVMFGSNGFIGDWRAVEGRALAGGNAAARVWYRVDGNDRIVEVGIFVLVSTLERSM
jgi:hypothetical protein